MRLILLPGMDGTGELFKPLLDTFSADIGVSVIAYPQHDSQRYVDLVAHVRKQLPDNDDYILLAESFSGPVAVEIARQGDQHLKSVIFVASFIRPPHPLIRLLKFFPMSLSSSLLFSVPLPDFTIRKILLGDKASDETVKLFKNTLLKVSKEVLSCRLQEIASLDIAHSRIRIRSIYIQATNDKLVPKRNVAPFESMLEGIRVVRVSGPHFLLQANPAACANIIEQEYRALKSQALSQT